MRDCFREEGIGRRAGIPTYVGKISSSSSFVFCRGKNSGRNGKRGKNWYAYMHTCLGIWGERGEEKGMG